MFHSHRNRDWLSVCAWRLLTLATCATAIKTDSHANSDISHPGHQSLKSIIRLDSREYSEPLEQCPKPEPCYRSAKSEFCVFVADAGDRLDMSTALPIVAEHERALKIIDLVSDADLTRHNQSSRLKYAVGPVPGKGLGVISTGNLERGDHILSDMPSIIVDHCVMASVPQYHLARLMNEATGRLSDHQRERIMSLAVFGDKAPDEHYLVGRIYATSAYMLEPDGELLNSGCGIGALFPQVSRMNHDCRPNAAYHFDPDTAAMEVHAVRPIASGEEITVSYISPFLVHDHRRKLLHDRWGFKCRCAACSASVSEVNASNTRLEKITSLWPLLLAEMADDGPSAQQEVDGFELAELLVSLSKEEQLDAVMLQPYRTAALEWNAVGDVSQAVRFAKLAVEYGTNSFGSRNRMVRDMQNLIEDPELHWSWSLRI